MKKIFFCLYITTICILLVSCGKIVDEGYIEIPQISEEMAPEGEGGVLESELMTGPRITDEE